MWRERGFLRKALQIDSMTIMNGGRETTRCSSLFFLSSSSVPFCLFGCNGENGEKVKRASRVLLRSPDSDTFLSLNGMSVCKVSCPFCCLVL